MLVGLVNRLTISQVCECYVMAKRDGLQVNLKIVNCNDSNFCLKLLVIDH